MAGSGRIDEQLTAVDRRAIYAKSAAERLKLILKRRSESIQPLAEERKGGANLQSASEPNERTASRASTSTSEPNDSVSAEQSRTHARAEASGQTSTVHAQQAITSEAKTDAEPSELQTLVEVVGNLRLELVQVRLIDVLFSGSLKVKVTRLHGGLSGSLVLRADSFDAAGRQEEPTVIKLDTEEEMRKEVEQTKYIAEQAGEGVIAMRREAVYLDGHGAVLLEMAGACWVMPEFYSSAGDDVELISTLKKRVTTLLVAAGLEKRRGDEPLITMAGQKLPVDTLASTESLVAAAAGSAGSAAAGSFGGGRVTVGAGRAGPEGGPGGPDAHVCHMQKLKTNIQ